jgi:uncharacterized protein with gpF-like domain
MPSVSAGRFPEPVLAERFLEKKVNAPTEKWDELKWGEHAHAFTVAHSNEAAVLDTIHGLANKALKEGVAFQDFKNGMLDMMKATGWYGGNGHTAEDTKYINWRIKIIYETNMRTAYMQAQYRKQLQGAALRPIWVYQSQLSGKNRRQDHIAFHGGAYRYDDPVWDKYYPPNGWGCQCYVTTKSEAGAERDGIKVGDSTKETLPEIDETWAYNPGREALAPNFNRYKNLPQDTAKQIYAQHRASMDAAKTTKGEFKKIIERANEADYKPLNINYTIGNLESGRFEAMRKAGVADSKIMATDHDVYRSAGHKNAKQKAPESLFNDVYETLQEPEKIFQEINPAHSGQEKIFHLVKETGGGKKIKIIVQVKTLKTGGTAMQMRTIGYGDYDYTGANYDEIKW